MNEIISKPFASALVEHGKKHNDVVVITNDLTASCEADEFAAAFPDRAFPFPPPARRADPSTPTTHASAPLSNYLNPDLRRAYQTDLAALHDCLA